MSMGAMSAMRFTISSCVRAAIISSRVSSASIALSSFALARSDEYSAIAITCLLSIMFISAPHQLVIKDRREVAVHDVPARAAVIRAVQDSVPQVHVAMRLHHTPSLAGVRHELRFLELSHFGLRPGLIVVLEREPATVSA